MGDTLWTRGLAALRGFLSGGTAKTTIVDADYVAIYDSAAATIKRVSFLTLKNQTLGDIDGLIYKGVINCSANPNYPAADGGHVYFVSVAGKIGGASGTVVAAGDMLICNTDETPAGTQAAVGAYWNILEKNVDFSNVTITGGTITGITDLAVADGGTGASTLTDHGVLLGSGTDPITALGAMTDGQLVIGKTGADPVVASITAGEGINTTAGAGTLTIACEDATTSNKGVTVYSGTTKALAGTDTASAMTPADVKTVLDARTLKEEIEPATDNISADQCRGSIINNYEQADNVVLTLPAIAAGMHFTVILGTTVAKYFRIAPNTSDSIYLDGVTTGDGKYVGVASAAAGNAIQFVAFQTGASAWDWFAATVSGAWVAEA